MSATSSPPIESDGPDSFFQAQSTATAVLDRPVPAGTPPFVTRVAAVPSPASSSVAVEAPPRHTSSKYDFVKVRVWLGENEDHYYVLSRFLIARMLTVTRMPHVVATKVALELKKLLVDHGLLDVSQGDLERNLFALMRRRGYGDDYVGRYRMMTSFYHRRIPLVIFITGLPCTGKSSVASLLAQRLNLPNVLQTDVVYELLQGMPESPLHALPLWARTDLQGGEEVVAEFCRECKIIRKGLEGDLSKALRDGKPVIIEGTHIDPDANFLSFSAAPPPLPTPLPPLPHTQPATPPLQPGAAPSAAWGTGSGGGGGGGGRGGEMGCGRVACADDPMDVEGSTPCAGWGGQGGTGGQGRGGGGGMVMVEEGRGRDECGGRGDGEQGHGAGEIVGGGLGEEGGRAQTLGSRESEGKHLRSGASSGGAAGAKGPSHAAQAEAAAASRGAGKRLRPIVVPIVLHMHPADHKVLLSEWIASNAPNAALLSQVPVEALLSRMHAVQRYLTSFRSQGVHVADISSTSFPRTIDNLHAHLLACIEQRCREDGWGTPGDEQL
ncbi:unnamed protein product [Closterium sp. Naga37s-1]|nr:unnamed protein product [Closterium sp. Naga37s-1]